MASLQEFLEQNSRARDLAIQHDNTSGVVHGYGTAGFRAAAESLPHVMLRVGMLAAIRSVTQGGRVIGVMVTASHNAAKDNGVKIVDPLGEMLASEWEKEATELANAPGNRVCEVLVAIANKFGALDWSIKPQVYVGYDTRASSVELSSLVIAGAESLSASVSNFGVLTTPQLHFLVRSKNLGEEASVSAYLQQLSQNFFEMLRLLRELKSSQSEESKIFENKVETVHVDCANGVGGVALLALAPLVESVIQFQPFNTNIEQHALLNHHCGAEHVQKTKTAPSGIDVKSEENCAKRFASVDGDADRVVYFYVQQNELKLLDGDKITALLTTLFQHLNKVAELNLHIGVVQTAYANGSSTDFFNSIGVTVDCVPTGVKHLHHQAEHYDIGVYFEANGHGTVLFHPSVSARLDAVINDATASPAKINAARALKCASRLANQAVGDAISDILLIESALSFQNWSLHEWNQLYTDLPSVQLKVRVANRAVIQTTNAERECVSPAGLQDAINEAVRAVNKGRSFVRPSGTEDVVRVYAEAATNEETASLGQSVSRAVYDLAQGVGPRP